jgi:dipeptidyl aminopeptidase/acylaminoacyl peptidase
MRRPTNPAGLVVAGLLAAALAVAPRAAAAQQPTPAVAAPAGAPRAVKRYAPEEFFKTVSYAGASFSPDGSKLLVSSNATGVFNAYVIPAAGGAPQPLTASTTDAVRVAGYFPRDERFLYTKDQGGNELTHLYVREQGGAERDLTPGSGFKAQFGGWMRDRRSFLLQTNERDRQSFDVFDVAADGYARTLLFRNPGGYYPGPASPDRRYVALTRPRTTSDADVWLHDRRTGATTNLTAHTGVVANAPADFTPDGSALLLLTNAGHEFTYLVRHDLATGARTTLLRPEWDVSFAEFSETGRYLVVGINADARTDLRVYAWPSMTRVALPAVPDAEIDAVAFARDDARIAFYASAPRSPRDLYVAALPGAGAGAAAAAAPRRLTRSLNPAVDPADLVDARVARFKSYDGVEVPGVLYLPHGATAASRAPAVVMVHGGPGGQARVGWNPLVQLLANHGYAVYDINNRGSSGYGKTFYAMDDKKHGEADLGDVVESKKLLVGTGVVDSARIGIAGGSYGGYMVLAALTQRPDAFAAGVDIFGVSNWLRTLRSIPAWWGAQREALHAELGDPNGADSVRLRRISPLFNAGRIRRPLLVLQGANDPRVLQVESDEIVAAARRNGVPVEYLVFPDEGHGFARRENQVRGYGAVVTFLDRHLKRGAAM